MTPEPFSPFPYQRPMVRWLLDRDVSALFCSPSLGKILLDTTPVSAPVSASETPSCRPTRTGMKRHHQIRPVESRRSPAGIRSSCAVSGAVHLDIL